MVSLQDTRHRFDMQTEKKINPSGKTPIDGQNLTSVNQSEG